MIKQMDLQALRKVASIKNPKIDKYLFLFVFIVSSHLIFGQNFSESFIQFDRDVEAELVTETESKLTWVDPNTNQELTWDKDNIKVDQMPRFEGCESLSDNPGKAKRCAEEKLLQYLYSNLVFPIEALEDKVEGRTIVSFYVNPDGKLSNAKMVRDNGAYTDGASLDVINKMNEEITWTPGKSNGKVVPVLYSLPILFRPLHYNRIIHPKMYSKYYKTNDNWELVYDTEGEETLNENAEVRMLISDTGKVLNTRIYNTLSPTAKDRAIEIILDLLNHSSWKPGSITNFEDTVEYVFTLRM